MNSQDAARGPDIGTWFEAPTPSGLLRLQAEVQAPAAGHAAAAAICLARCGDLLAALDRWVGFDLAWRWSVAPTPRIADGAQAGVHWPDVHCLLVCDWALLRALPIPPATLAERMQWPAVQAVLSVARLHLDAEELSQLEPGGAVILPPSLLAVWRGRLRGIDEPARAGVGLPVLLPTPLSPRFARGPAGAATTEQDADGDRWPCEVRLGTTYTLAGNRLTGWFDEALGEVGPGASIWTCATGREPASCLATGQLMPWGDGWALALESLCEDRNLPVGA